MTNCPVTETGHSCPNQGDRQDGGMRSSGEKAQGGPAAVLTRQLGILLGLEAAAQRYAGMSG